MLHILNPAVQGTGGRSPPTPVFLRPCSLPLRQPCSVSSAVFVQPEDSDDSGLAQPLGIGSLPGRGTSDHSPQSLSLLLLKSRGLDFPLH